MIFNQSDLSFEVYQHVCLLTGIWHCSHLNKCVLSLSRLPRYTMSKSTALIFILFFAILLKLEQPVSTLLYNLCALKGTLVFLCALMGTLVYPCALMGTLVYPCAFICTLVYACALMYHYACPCLCCAKLIQWMLLHKVQGKRGRSFCCVSGRMLLKDFQV